MKHTIVITIALIVAACAPQQPLTPAQHAKSQRCKYESIKYSGGAVGWNAGVNQAIIYAECMKQPD